MFNPNILYTHVRSEVGLTDVFPYPVFGYGRFADFCEATERDLSAKNLLFYLMTLVVGQFMSVIQPPSNEETQRLAYPAGFELVEGEAPVNDGIVLGGTDFTVDGANRFCHSNWQPIRQYVFDLSICDNVKKLSDDNIKNWFEANRVATSEFPTVIEVKKVISFLSKKYGNTINIEQVRLKLSNTDWIRYRLASTSAGSLCVRVFGDIDEKYIGIVSIADREAAAIAAASPWDAALARNISARGLALAYIYIKNYEIGIKDFWMGQKAKDQLGFNEYEQLEAIVKRLRDVNGKIKKIGKQLSEDEAYLAYIGTESATYEDRAAVAAAVNSRALTWRTEIVASSEVKKFKEALLAGESATIETCFISYDEMAAVDKTKLGYNSNLNTDGTIDDVENELDESGNPDPAPEPEIIVGQPADAPVVNEAAHGIDLFGVFDGGDDEGGNDSD